jgi:hypothetical protein
MREWKFSFQPYVVPENIYGAICLNKHKENSAQDPDGFFFTREWSIHLINVRSKLMLNNIKYLMARQADIWFKNIL